MKEGNKLKDKLKKVLSLLLTVLMTFSLIQMNQIQNVHAATLYPEADASVTVVANNVNISAFGSTETDLYKIKLGGTSAFVWTMVKTVGQIIYMQKSVAMLMGKSLRSLIGTLIKKIRMAMVKNSYMD